MKKFLTLSLVLVLLLTSAVALADEPTTQQKTTQLTLNVASLYEWTVPASLNLTPPTSSSGYDQNNEIIITIDTYSLMDTKQLLITCPISGKLTGKAGGEIQYDMFLCEDHKIESQQSKILTGKGSVAFVPRLKMDEVYAAELGEYTGSVTFTASVTDRH